MDNEKELERLKWDYWNKSKLFKLVWRYFHAIKLNRNNPASNPYLNEVKQLKNGIYSPVQLGADTRKYRLYFYFHEYTPENADFDKYWNFEQERKSKPPFNKPYKRIYVEDYSELIENDFEYAINQFKRENNRNPKINEVKEYLLKSIREDKRSIYFKINQYDFTIKEAEQILKEVEIILKKRAYRAKPEPKTLRKYLRAWELRHESKPPKSYLEIFNILIKEKDYDLADKEGKAKLYVVNARKIMKNIEAGMPFWWKIERQIREDYLKQFPKYIPSRV